MKAEVISIGDELTSGQRLDTNTQWLSQRLTDLGVRVLYHTTVGDDLEANTSVFRQSFQRADLIVTSGGLGPTADDLTREALAQATTTDLILDEGALHHIRTLFARRKREMPPRNEVQAMIPRGSQIIPNPHGSAPGIDMLIARPGQSSARIFALPGVPAEMKEMWEQTVQPTIEGMLGQQRRIIRSRTLKCFGVGESDLEAMLPDLIRRGRQPTVGITVSRATISLRIVAEGCSEQECLCQIEPTVATIHQCLGSLVFGEGDEELSHVVARMLAARHLTLATAETDSGGLMEHWLNESDPQHGSFVGGIVRARFNCDTPQKAAALAEEARQMFDADFGIALGHIPLAGSATGDVGSVPMAIATRTSTFAKSFQSGGHPDIVKPRAVKQVLNFLRLHLIEQDS